MKNENVQTTTAISGEMPASRLSMDLTCVREDTFLIQPVVERAFVFSSLFQYVSFFFFVRCFRFLIHRQIETKHRNDRFIDVARHNYSGRCERRFRKSVAIKNEREIGRCLKKNGRTRP